MNIAACPAEVARERVMAEQHSFEEGGKLTARQEKFVEHCAVYGNATEAAQLAGYAEKSAKVMACRLTKDNRIPSSDRLASCRTLRSSRSPREK